MWTLLNFVDKNAFFSLPAFLEKFGNLKDAAQLEALQAKLKPYLLRRVKEHVERSVPPKEELIIEVELTVAQKQYYRAIYENNKTFLFRSGSQDGPTLTNLAMELRKCCNHPFLVRGAEKALLEHFHKDNPIDVMVDSSGKLVLLDKLLPKLLAGHHKVLLFSQFRIMLDILEDYMALRGYLYERIDGAITGAKRQSAIDRFSAPNSKSFVMLLSTKAGGVGINLTSADTVIIFDSDWNPQNDIQAQARSHRIGQKKPVKVYRLLTRKTYEMHLFQVASMKLGLDYAVMHNLKSSISADKDNKEGLRRNESSDVGLDGDGPSLGNLNKKEIEHLLKHGAYDIFREEKEGKSEEESRRFCDADIDQILERSTLVVHKSNISSDEGVEAGLSSDAATHNKNLGGALNSFSKASFVSSKEVNDVDVNDPQFWEKIVGLANDEKPDEEDEFEITEAGLVVKKRKKRQCRTTKVYNEPETRTGNSKLAPALSKGDASGSEFSGASSDSSDGMSIDDENGRRSRKKKAKILELSVSEAIRQRSSFVKSIGCKSSLNMAAVDTNILTALSVGLQIHGYGQWDAIAVAAGRSVMDSWSTNDIAFACSMLVLEMYRIGCTPDTIKGGPRSSANDEMAALKRLEYHGKKLMSSRLLVSAICAVVGEGEVDFGCSSADYLALYLEQVISSSVDATVAKYKNISSTELISLKDSIIRNVLEKSSANMSGFFISKSSLAMSRTIQRAAQDGNKRPFLQNHELLTRADVMAMWLEPLIMLPPHFNFGPKEKLRKDRVDLESNFDLYVIFKIRDYTVAQLFSNEAPLVKEITDRKDM